MIPQVSVEELKIMIDQNIDFDLIDIREDHERKVNHIPKSKHIPMNTFLQDLPNLEKNKTYVIQCRSGGRSTKVVQEMQKEGFQKSYNLTGGIIDWIQKIDPSQDLE